MVGQTDVMKLTVAFRNFATATDNRYIAGSITTSFYTQAYWKKPPFFSSVRGVLFDDIKLNWMLLIKS